MQKNTHSHSDSKTGNIPVSPSILKKADQKPAEPSARVIENILNYSKALHIEPLPGKDNFIEYLDN